MCKKHLVWFLLFSITGHNVCLDCYILMPCIQRFSLDVIMCMYGSLGYRLHTSLLLFTVCVSCFDAFSPCVCASDVSVNQTACVMLYVQDLQKRTGGILFNITKGLRRSVEAWVWVVRENIPSYPAHWNEFTDLNFKSPCVSDFKLFVKSSKSWRRAASVKAERLFRQLFFFFATCASRQSACVSASVGHLRWSRAARCSLCSGKHSHSSEVWEGIRSTGWCGETGGCAFPLWEAKKRVK